MSGIDWLEFIREGEERMKNRSPIEIERDNLVEEYKKKFGYGVGYSIGGHIPASIEEEIEEIRECLRTGVPQKDEKWDSDNMIAP